MTILKILKRITLLSSLFLSPNLWACVDLSLNVVYSSFDLTSSPTANLPLKVSRKNKGQGCTYFLGFERGSSPTYDRKLYNGTNTVDFQLYKDGSFSAPLKDGNDISSTAERIAGNFPFGGNGPTENTENFYAVLTPPTSFKPIGTYTDTFVINLYRFFFGFYFLADSGSMTFTYTIPAMVSLSIVPPGQPHDPNSTGLLLDFGVLNENESKNFDTLVLSNTDYEIKVSSQNGGKLQHQSVSQKINYEFTFNGTPFNLTPPGAATTVVTGVGPTPPNGDRYSGNVQIGSLTNKVAGTYEDTVTITVEAF